MGKVIIAYIPVLHRGYLDFFDRHRDAEALYVIKRNLVIELQPALRKDIRAFDAFEVQSLLGNHFFLRVEIADGDVILAIAQAGHTVVMPKDELSLEIALRYLSGCRVEYDSAVFLRWDRQNVLEQKIKYDRKVPWSGVVGEMMNKALEEKEKATNLWRQVGAVIARDGEILLSAYNRQVPSPYTPYYEGDARMFFKRGIHIGLTTDIHAESRLVAEAARHGIALEGADLYISTFPCPPCAKLIASTGIRRCYFSSGYAMLDGERVLHDTDIEIVFVEELKRQNKN